MKNNLLKKNKAHLVLLSLSILFIFFPLLARAEINQIREFNKNDRVLILAPHPDDEAIGTAGVIHRALKAGTKVKVVLFTSGDHNELAFIYDEKRLTFRKGEFIHMGDVRREESFAAMGFLGLNKNDIVSLGYPDFGTMEIMTKYWGKTRPFKDFLTRISKVPYEECLSFQAPYVGESILKDLKTVIFDFKPTIIFVSHPVDANRDHRALNLFLRVALWDLEKQIDPPQVIPYLIHVVGWPLPRGYHPELALNPPKQFDESGARWNKLDLNPDEIKIKYAAISYYKSQIKPMPPYLFTFARKNELFGDYPAIKLVRSDPANLNWQDVSQSEYCVISPGPRSKICGLAYARDEKNLFINLTLRRKIDKNFGVSLYLLGYSKNTEFAKMPKIRLGINLSGLNIRDKKQTLFIKDTQLKYKRSSIFIKIPLVSLGNPDYILASGRTNVKGLTFDDTAWRILDLD